MARRRSRSKSRWPLVLGIAAVAAAGVAAWRYGPALLASRARAPTVASSDVCGLLDSTSVVAALGAPEVTAFRRGAAADVPAAGACAWSFPRSGGGTGSVVAMLFTPDSLAHDGQRTNAAAFYASTVTGLEYALKSVPVPVAALGDAAAVAGFDADDPRRGQLVVRRGERVLHLVADGADRAAVEALAGRLVARL
jgi:hypothetical protein